MSATAAARLLDLARADPTVAPLALLQAEALRAAADHALPWELRDPNLDARSDSRPALYRQNLRVNPRDLQRLLSRLARAADRGHLTHAAEALHAVERGAVPALTLLEASINQDTARLQALAEPVGLETALLTTLGQLMALPLLQGWREAEADWLAQVRWEAGYCPVCAAWPSLAELRGLDAEFWLRCGRCGAGWPSLHGRCVYCGNTDHRTQGYLAPEAEREARRATTCDACRGYLKTVTSFGPIPPDELAVYDLTTLELDVAAIGQGYNRPEVPAFALGVTLMGVEGHRLPSFLWRH